MRQFWRSDPCYEKDHGVNGSICSFISYLSEVSVDEKYINFKNSVCPVMLSSSLSKAEFWSSPRRTKLKKMAFCLLVLPSSNIIYLHKIHGSYPRFKCVFIFQFLKCITTYLGSVLLFLFKAFFCYFFLSGWEVVSFASWKKDGKWWEFTKIKSNSCKLIGSQLGDW